MKRIHDILDINECLTLNGGCSQLCDNSVGSFNCYCRRGYRVKNNNPKSCQDIDECVKQKPCDLKNGICKNVMGSYQCSCKAGYKLLPDKVSCVGMY